MLLKLIAAVEAKEEFTVTLLDCMYLLRLAWEIVSAKTIANSFLHCGFQTPEESLPCPQETEEDPSTLGEALLSRLGSYSADLPEGVTFQEFISVDSQVNTTATLTTEDIVATVKLNNEDHNMDAENEEDISNSQLPYLPPTIRECEKGLETVKRFFEVRQSAERQLSIISDLEFSLAEIATILYKQSTIIDYMDKM